MTAGLGSEAGALSTGLPLPLKDQARSRVVGRTRVIQAHFSPREKCYNTENQNEGENLPIFFSPSLFFFCFKRRKQKNNLSP